MSDRGPADRPAGSGRVVAELGRPETPQETAERKARDRAVRRSRQTTKNLLAALAACLGVVALLILVVPFADAPTTRDVDVAKAAESAGDTAGAPLIVPVVPAGWKATSARLRGSGATATWYVGYVTGSDYAAFDEGLSDRADWVADRFDGDAATGTVEVAGLRWREWDRRGLGTDAGNAAYGLAATTSAGVPVVVYGTAPAATVRALAAAVAADAAAKGLALEGTAA